MKMSVKSKLNFSNGRIAIAMLGVSVLTACGGGQGGMKMGDNEFAVMTTAYTSSHQTKLILPQ